MNHPLEIYRTLEVQLSKLISCTLIDLQFSISYTCGIYKTVKKVCMNNTEYNMM